VVELNLTLDFCSPLEILLFVLVPNPLASPPIADAYDDYAIITWSPASDCLLFNVYILTGSIEVPLNNGEGLH